VDIGFLNPSRVTELALWAYKAASRDQPGSRLRHMENVKISALTGLKKLELWYWKEWDDLAPLGGLPLEELSCETCCMLLDIMGPGSLENLKCISLADYGNINLTDWLSNRAIDHEQALAVVSEALLELPKLCTLAYKHTWRARAGNTYGSNYLYGGSTVVKIATLQSKHWCRREGEAGRLLFDRVKV
jgi:hypothetical protein